MLDFFMRLELSDSNAKRLAGLSNAVRYSLSDADTTQLTQTAKITVPASTVDQVLSLGALTTTTLCMLIVHGNCSVKLNGIGAPSIPLLITPANQSSTALPEERVDQPGFLVLRGEVTSIHITNPSTSTPLEVYVTLIGV